MGLRARAILQKKKRKSMHPSIPVAVYARQAVVSNKTFWNADLPFYIMALPMAATQETCCNDNTSTYWLSA